MSSTSDSSGITIKGNPGVMVCDLFHKEGEETYCEHIYNYIQSGEDWIMVNRGHRYMVPVFPHQNIWCEVALVPYAGLPLTKIQLCFAPDIGRPYEVQLGLWNQGEGLKSLRTVVLDYMRSKLDTQDSLSGNAQIKTKCPQRSHSLRSARKMAEHATDDEGWRIRCMWSIVMEKACIPCMADSGTSDNNFGIDDSVLPAGPGNPLWRT